MTEQDKMILESLMNDFGFEGTLDEFLIQSQELQKRNELQMEDDLKYLFSKD